jgi:hypothetical protein
MKARCAGGLNPNPQVDESKFLWMSHIPGFTRLRLCAHWVKDCFCMQWHYHRIQCLYQALNLRIWVEKSDLTNAG